jgi:3-methyladenine DNA glycosylase Tag
METFKTIRARAVKKQGGEEALKVHLAKPKSAAVLKKISDDRWLAAMTRSVFQAGFSWKVIEAKWDGFEDAFDHFNPHRVAFYSGDDLNRLVSDKRIVRNGAKIKATVENARFVVELAKEYGSAGAFFAASKSENYVNLLDFLKKRGSRLSGASAQYFLRFSGVDSFILSPSVTAALIKAGVIDKPVTSAKGLRVVQTAFDKWQKESGCSLTEISRVLAFSIDA